MALTTLEDVQDAIPQIVLSEASKPKTSDVVQWIDDTEAVLVATLANLPAKGTFPPDNCVRTIATPIDPSSSPVSASLFRDMVVHAVVARILRARLFGVGDADMGGAKQAQQYYDDRVKWLADPSHPFGFPDAELTVDCSGAVSWGRILGEMGDGYRPQPKMRTVF